MYKRNKFNNYFIALLHLTFIVCAMQFVFTITIDILDINSIYLKILVGFFWLTMGALAIKDFNYYNFNYSYWTDIEIFLYGFNTKSLIKEAYNMGLWFEGLNTNDIKITSFYTDKTIKPETQLITSNYNKRTNYSFKNIWLKDKSKVYEIEFSLNNNYIVHVQAACISQFTPGNVYPVRFYLNDEFIDGEDYEHDYDLLKSKMGKYSFNKLKVLIKELGKELAIDRNKRFNKRGWKYEKDTFNN